MPACVVTSSAETGSSSHEHVRIGRERSGDRDALALTARKAGGATVEQSRLEPDLRQQFDARRPRAAPREVEDAPHRVARVERPERILRNEPHGRIARQRGRPVVGPLRADEQACEGRLPRPGLADDPERLARAQAERRVVDGACGSVPTGQVLGLEHDVAGGGGHGLRTVRDRREERPRRRVRRGAQHPFRGALLHGASALEHRHAVGDAAHRGEVVGDEDHSGAVGGEGAEQLEHPHGDGRIERGRRFVGDDQPRAADDGRRDQHALAHASRQLARAMPERRNSAFASPARASASRILGRRSDRGVRRTASVSPTSA